MLTLLWTQTWEFECSMGPCEQQSLLRGKTDNMLRCLLSSWSSPLPIQYTAPSSGEQYRDKSWLNFIFSCSKKDTCELLSSRGHYPPVTFSSLFGNRAFPLLFPTSYVLPHPARGEHVLAPAPRTRVVCNTSCCCMHRICQHPPHCHCHMQTRWKHRWLVLTQNISLTLSSFSFPAPRDSLPARIFAPTVGAIRERLLNDLAAAWQIVEPTCNQSSRFFAWFPRETELLQPRCCEILGSKWASL